MNKIISTKLRGCCNPNIQQPEGINIIAQPKPSAFCEAQGWVKDSGMNPSSKSEIGVRIATDPLINSALKEDVDRGDITAKLISKTAQSHARIISQQTAIICGIDFVRAVFAKIDTKIKITWLIKDGSLVSANQCLCNLVGPTRSLLTGERTALNFLQTLSSTATLSNQFASKIKGTKAILLDTRKTLPGLRLAQKYAVTCGGGHNHRFGLYDAVLIKENQP
jgi:nicotinate-nucleotide pyrophosphorylase (carboxylating)